MPVDKALGMMLLHKHKASEVTGLEAGYLKLDASNDPITGNLLIKPTSNSTTTFQTQPSGSTTPVFNVDTTNSRVGIGLAAPLGDLHIEDTLLPATLYLSNSQPTVDVGVEFGNINFYSRDPSGGGQGIRAQIKAIATEVHAGTAQGTALTFITSSTSTLGLIEAMRIDKLQNVGIGMTPTVRLDVTGRTILTGTTDDHELIVKANATQSANIQEWQSSTGTILGYMDYRGGIGSSPTITAIDSSTEYGQNLITQYTPTAGGAKNIYGHNVSLNIATGAFTHTGNWTAGQNRVVVSGAGNISFAQGLLNSTDIYNTGTTGSAYGMGMQIVKRAGSGALSNIRAMNATIYNQSATNVTIASNFHVVETVNSGTGAINNVYGLFIERQNQGTNNYAIATNDGLVWFGDAETIFGCRNAVQLTVKGRNTVSANISLISVASNVVTITTATAHQVRQGETITIAGATTLAAINGSRVITRWYSTTKFSFALTTADLAETAETGTVASSQLSAIFQTQTSAGVISNTFSNPSLTATAAENTFNETGDPLLDFRVETDTYDALFVDSSNNSIMVMSNAAGKIGFYGVTAVTQPAHIADPTGGATVDAEARTAINSINALLATLGLSAAT